MKLRFGLRTLLAVLTIGALFGLCGLSVYQLTHHADAAVDLARAQLRSAALLGAVRQEELEDSARQLLATIAEQPALRAGETRACEGELGRLRRRFPAFIDFGIVDPNGVMLCHALGSAGAAPAGRRPYLADVLAQRRFAGSELVQMPAPDGGAILYGMPLPGDDQPVTGLAYAVLGLQTLSRALGSVPLPEGARLDILDRSASTLVSTEPGAAGGAGLPDQALLQALQKHTPGRREDLARDDARQRVYALVPVRAAASSDLFAVASMDRARVVASGRSLLALQALLPGFIALALAWFAWRAGRRAVVEPGRHGLAAAAAPDPASMQAWVARPAGNGETEAGLARSRQTQPGLEASRDSEAWFRDLFAGAATGIAIISVEGRFVQANPAYCAMLGYTETELQSMHIRSVTPADDVLFSRAVATRLLAGEIQGQIHERRYVAKDARMLWGRTSLSVMRSADGRPLNIISVVEDITERKRYEAENQTRARQQAAVAELGRRALKAEGLTPLMNDAVSLIAEVFGVPFCHLLALTADASHFELMAAASALPDRTGRTMIAGGPASQAGFTLASSEPVVIEDCATESRFQPAAWLLEHGVVSGISVVVAGEQGPWGILDVYATHGRAFTHDDVNFMQSAANLLAEAIRRIRADQAVRQSEETLQFVLKAAGIGYWEIDYRSNTRRQSLLHDQLFGYSGPQPAWDMATFIAHVHPDDRSHAERCFQDAEAGAGDYSFEHRVVWPDQSVHWLLSMGRLERDAQGQPLRGSGARLDITARVDAERELQEYQFALQRAAEATEAIAQHRTLESALQEVALQARSVIRTHQAMISLSRNQDWSLAISAISLSGKYQEFLHAPGDPDSSGLAALVCAGHRPMRLTQDALQAHPHWRGRHENAPGQPALRGWLAVPLKDREGRNIGLLQLSDKYEGEFTRHDEYVAQEMARFVSVAIENATLFEQIRELNAELEQKVAERTAALAHQEALFRALSEQAPQVVWTVGGNDEGVTYLNRKWYELMGGEPADWLGDQWLKAIHPEDREQALLDWQRARQNGQPYEGIRRLRASTGAYRTMSYRATPVLEDSGEIAFWVGIDTDITELKAIEAALRQSNKELGDFAYSVSHDLRSPLNTVDGFSRLLARQLTGRSDEKTQHYLARIQFGVGQMGQLIEGLLALTKVSLLDLRTEALDLSAVAGEILHRYQRREPGRRASIAIQDGLSVGGDARLIRIVMENLLGNAWKFSSLQPHAEIAFGRLAGDAAEPVYFVRDNGVGFDMAFTDKLFKTFQRLHPVADFPGTGVGLALASRILGRHGGRIWAESQPGRGATFFFTLPGSTRAVRATDAGDQAAEPA